MSIKTPYFKSILSLVIVTGIFSFLVFKLSNEWETLSRIRFWEHPLLIFLHILLLILMYSSFVTGWFFSLKASKFNLKFSETAFIWLVPNLGKYIPGKVFMIAGRIALSKWFNIRQSECICAMTVEHIYMLLATFPFIVFFINNEYLSNYSISIVLYLLIILFGLIFIFKPSIYFSIFNKALTTIRRAPVDASLTLRRNLAMVVNYSLAWMFYGLSGVVLVHILGLGGEVSALLVMSAFVVSWMLGFLSMLTPGGIGVREAVIVLLLSSQLQAADAIALALIARITWTMVEMCGVLLGLVIKRKYLENNKS